MDAPKFIALVCLSGSEMWWEKSFRKESLIMRIQGVDSHLKQQYRGQFAESEIEWRIIKIYIHIILASFIIILSRLLSSLFKVKKRERNFVGHQGKIQGGASLEREMGREPWETSSQAMWVSESSPGDQALTPGRDEHKQKGRRAYKNVVVQEGSSVHTGYCDPERQ